YSPFTTSAPSPRQYRAELGLNIHPGLLHLPFASVHPISARESRALRKLLREAPTSPYVFISERRAPLSVAGYQRMVARAPVRKVKSNKKMAEASQCCTDCQ